MKNLVLTERDFKRLIAGDYVNCAQQRILVRLDDLGFDWMIEMIEKEKAKQKQSKGGGNDLRT